MSDVGLTKIKGKETFAAKYNLPISLVFHTVPIADHVSTVSATDSLGLCLLTVCA